MTPNPHNHIKLQQIELYNPKLLVIVAITSLIGSIPRIAIENSVSRIKFSKILVNISCSLFFASMFYLLAFAGHISELLAGIGTLVTSLFALDIVNIVTQNLAPLIIKVMTGLPSYFLNHLNDLNNSKNDLDNK